MKTSLFPEAEFQPLAPRYLDQHNPSHLPPSDPAIFTLWRVTARYERCAVVCTEANEKGIPPNNFTIAKINQLARVWQ
ncbi:hypothetical protein [Sphingomonas oryzagri]|uniref:Uncharacterized protein n=1 Tax=Sphingomonas oryzagri TaxID=3042314 RepID=A0ABT6N7N8_9SPHN|nr:hypothetical protein [Sphingomonas oryzagri]MDH7641129.1 hypothetical protein [Sphingomonas oryzagri]